MHICLTSHHMYRALSRTCESERYRARARACIGKDVFCVYTNMYKCVFVLFLPKGGLSIYKYAYACVSVCVFLVCGCVRVILRVLVCVCVSKCVCVRVRVRAFPWGFQSADMLLLRVHGALLRTHVCVCRVV